MEKKEFSRAALVTAVLAIVLLSSCGAQGTQNESSTAGESTPVPLSGETSGEVSSMPEESAENAQNEMVNLLPQDGKLRFVNFSDDARTVVFRGNEMIYDGDGYASALSRGDENYYYVRTTTDGSYVSSLYKDDGTLLLEGLPGYLQISGKWLVSTPYADMSGESKKAVYNLDTLAAADISDWQGSMNAGDCFVSGDYIAFNNYSDESTFFLCSADDLSVIETFPGCSGYIDNRYPDTIILNAYESDNGNIENILYYPSDGTRIEHIEYFCDNGVVLQRTDGGYVVIDTKSDTVLEEDAPLYRYYSDAVKIWDEVVKDDTMVYYNTVISAPCYNGTTIIANAYHTEGEEFVNVTHTDGRIDLLTLDGELQLSVMPQEGNIVYYAGEGIISEQNADWQTPGVTLHFTHGPKLMLDRYSSVNALWGSDYLTGNYEVNGKYLTDILDLTGNILIEGVSNYYSPDEDGIITCQKGFSYGLMNIARGEWLWKDSIFQSAAEESGDDYYGY